MLSKQEEIIVMNKKKSYNWVSTDSKIWMKLLEKSSRSWLTKTLTLLLMMMKGLSNKRLVLPSVRRRQQAKQKEISLVMLYLTSQNVAMCSMMSSLTI